MRVYYYTDNKLPAINFLLIITLKNWSIMQSVFIVTILIAYRKGKLWLEAL